MRVRQAWWGYAVAFAAGVVAAYALALLVVLLAPEPVARQAWATARAGRGLGGRAVYVVTGWTPR